MLEFLLAHGLAAEKKGKYEAGSRYLFIEKGSPFVLQHHTNWRIQAIQSVARGSEDDVHLSMTVSLSEQETVKLRQRIAEFIEEASARIKASPEERLMTFNLDFFEV